MCEATLAKLPGKPVRGSTTGRPIMALMDILGQRWTLRILWELSKQQATFRALRASCDDISPTLLNKRLKDLRIWGLIELGKNGYGLTKAGTALAEKLAPLDAWANEWAKGINR